MPEWQIMEYLYPLQLRWYMVSSDNHFQSSQNFFQEALLPNCSQTQDHWLGKYISKHPVNSCHLILWTQPSAQMLLQMHRLMPTVHSCILPKRTQRSIYRICHWHHLTLADSFECPATKKSSIPQVIMLYATFYLCFYKHYKYQFFKFCCTKFIYTKSNCPSSIWSWRYRSVSVSGYLYSQDWWSELLLYRSLSVH